MKNPFVKGNWYYELQILMFVIMWKIDPNHKPSGEQNALVNWGRLYIWYDSAWRFHGIWGSIRFFLYSLTKNADKFKNPFAKLRVIRINAKNMFRHWALEVPLIDSLLSLNNYIRLHKAGFRITRSSSDDMDAHIYRFWWGIRAINRMPDIDQNGEYFNTMYDGKSEQLGDRE